ncbi:MAG: DUF6629 family protein [Bacteroidota bacterium]
MCFSATASFGASSILAVAGIASLKKAENKSQILFASIPIIFSIQQFTEGFVWLSLTHSDYNHWQNILINIFLSLAQVVWPIWVPLSILLLEKNTKRRKAMKIFLSLGILLAAFLAHRLLFYHATAEITPYHIHYALDFPYEQYTIILSIFYFLTTIVPPFLSDAKRMTSLGLLNLTSFIITIVFFENYVVSVWCFFSALISWEVFLVMKNLNIKMQNI